jgi:hypothetical protein
VRGLVCNLETLDERPELREFKRNALRIAVNWLNSYARSRSMLSPFPCPHAPLRRPIFGHNRVYHRIVRGVDRSGGLE